MELPKCSFCGKSQRDTKQLIAGPGAYICNECVALCADLCVEANRQAGPDPQEPLLADGPSAPLDIPEHPAGPSTTHRKVFKYNEDHILEILSEYLADANGFDTFSSRSIPGIPRGRERQDDGTRVGLSRRQLRPHCGFRAGGRSATCPAWWSSPNLVRDSESRGR